MKIALLILFVSASLALASKYPVSISTTNGRGFGTTTFSSLVGKADTGNVTNAAGVRVAYLSDVGTVTATNVNDVFSYVLSNAVASGASSVALDRSVAFPNTVAGRLAIGYGETNMEIRSVSGIIGSTVSLNAVTGVAHPSGSRVVWFDSGSVALPSSGIAPDSSVDSAWETLQLLEEGGTANTWIEGDNQSVWTTVPLVSPNSTRLRNIQLNAKAGFPLGNTNVYIYQGRQGVSVPFSASAATDVITVPGGWSPPGSPSNACVVFYAFGTNVLPQPLSNGVPYFVVTNSSTAFTVKANVGDTTKIDLTTSGTGIVKTEVGSLGKDTWDWVYINGQGQTNVYGFNASLQQQSSIRNSRIDNCGIAMRLTGQQAVFDNMELIGDGIGIDMRPGALDSDGAQFMYFFGLNAEQFRTNAIVLGGRNNLFAGVHLEAAQSTSLPVIDGSQVGSGSVFESVTLGGSANTNTLFLMGTAGGFSSYYDLRNIYMASATFDGPQLVLNDPYRGHRIFAYSSTNGTSTRYVGRLFAPPIPTSTTYSSKFGGETWLWQGGGYFTGPQQHLAENSLEAKAGTNQTGHVLQFLRSDGSSGVGFSANALLSIATNYVASDFIPVVGRATFPISNAVLYMVTQTKTNVISDGR